MALAPDFAGVEEYCALRGESRSAEDEALRVLKRLNELFAVAPSNKRAAVDSAVVYDYILRVLGEHRTNPTLAREGLRAVLHLASTSVEAKSRLVAVCPLIVETIGLHSISNSVDVIEFGLFALGNLALLESNKSILAESGAHKVLASSLSNPGLTHSPSFVRKAMFCIGSFSLGHAQSRRLLGDSGACEGVVKLLIQMRRPDDKVMGKNGAWAIACLAADNPRNRSRLGDSGAAQVVTELMKSSFNEDGTKAGDLIGLAEKCCSAVAALATHHRTNRIRLGEAGACEAVVRILREYAAFHPVSSAAVRAIGWLGHGNEPNAALLGDCGACELLLGIVSCETSSDQPTFKSVQLALQGLAESCTNNAVRIRSSDGPGASILKG